MVRIEWQGGLPPSKLVFLNNLQSNNNFIKLKTVTFIG